MKKISIIAILLIVSCLGLLAKKLDLNQAYQLLKTLEQNPMVYSNEAEAILDKLKQECFEEFVEKNDRLTKFRKETEDIKQLIAEFEKMYPSSNYQPTLQELKTKILLWDQEAIDVEKLLDSIQELINKIDNVKERITKDKMKLHNKDL